MKKFKAFSAKLAQFLVLKGFEVISVEPNIHHLQFNVWVFEDSPEIQQAYTEYCESLPKKE